jgi:membrane-bound lytic murein transglycosylase D
MTVAQKRRLSTSLLCISIGLTALIILHSAFRSSEINDSSSSNILPAVSPYIPDKLEFCGEPVPLKNFDVFESLEREMLVNTYYHSQTILFIKKANRYFPIIEPILKENNIPDDFKYLAVAESGLANVVSPAQASGFWQLLESTANDYGLEVNEEVDERYHLEKSTEAACKFLQDSYNMYENWTLVAASYNVGRKGIDRQIDRQGEHDYYNLLFNEETSRYIFRILAIKLVLSDPTTYGFDINPDELYNPISYEELTIDESIPDIGEFAREHGTNYKLLKYSNPWLRENKLTNSRRKEYTIKIPISRK